MTMEKRRIYLDHNATTPIHPEVKKVLVQALDLFGNPSSLHGFGRDSRKAIEDSRETISAFIGAQPSELIFVGSGSEANNTVFNISSCSSSYHCTSACGKKHKVITTRIEHPCILETAKCLLERGNSVAYIDVDRYGKMNIDQLASMLDSETLLVSVMMANNEIGTIQDIRKIAQLVHSKGVLFHTDAVQAVGKIPVDVKELDVDFLSFSAHKIYGPKGVGALYVKKGVSFCPFIRGGHQEGGRRAGTENTLGIIGFGKAVQLRDQEMRDESKRLFELKQKAQAEIEKSIPDISFNGHPNDCLAGTLNVSFEGAEGEAILLYLDLAGIAVSTGSACASGSLDPSHVLLATGITPERAHGSIRISMGRSTTEEEINYTVQVLAQVIAKIRGMSTAYKKR